MDVASRRNWKKLAWLHYFSADIVVICWRLSKIWKILMMYTIIHRFQEYMNCIREPDKLSQSSYTIDQNSVLRPCWEVLGIHNSGISWCKVWSEVPCKVDISAEKSHFFLKHLCQVYIFIPVDLSFSILTTHLKRLLSHPFPACTII